MLSALLLLPGCGTMNRMDYLDQFFDPEAYAARHATRLPAVAGPAQLASLPSGMQPGTQIGSQGGTEAGPQAPAMPERRLPAPVAPALPAVATAEQAPAVPEGDRDQWIRSTVRRNPWLALNWAQLTPAQQQQIERRLSDAGSGRLMADGGPASVWDTMGLDDRTDLAFSTPGGPRMAGAASNRDGGYAARRR
jgi:hypothetical protein